MNLLLDTHVVVWALAAPDRPGPRSRAARIDPGNLVAVSAVTVWSVEIERALGTLTAPDGFASFCITRRFDELPITFDHAEVAGRLPRHRDDPFDRMLLAPAEVEQLAIVTSDPSFARDGVALLDATS